MGLRLLHLSGAAYLSGLPPSSRDAVQRAVAGIAKTDQGAIRRQNDRSADSRAQHFIDWCQLIDFQDVGFIKTPPEVIKRC